MILTEVFDCLLVNYPIVFDLTWTWIAEKVQVSSQFWNFSPDSFLSEGGDKEGGGETLMERAYMSFILETRKRCCLSSLRFLLLLDS